MTKKQTNIFTIIASILAFLICFGFGFVLGAKWLEINPRFSLQAGKNEANQVDAKVVVKGNAVLAKDSQPQEGLKILLTNTNPTTMLFLILNKASLKNGRDFVMSDNNGFFQFSNRKNLTNGWRMSFKIGDNLFDQKINFLEGDNNLKIEIGDNNQAKVFLNNELVERKTDAVISITTTKITTTTTSAVSTTTTSTTTSATTTILPQTGGEANKTSTAVLPQESSVNFPATVFSCNLFGKVLDKGGKSIKDINIIAKASDGTTGSGVSGVDGVYSFSIFLTNSAVVGLEAEGKKIESNTNLFCEEKNASQKLDLTVAS